MKSHQRPVPPHRGLLAFGPLLAAALGCGPAVPQEVVVPAIPVSTARTPNPEAPPEPPKEVLVEEPPPPNAWAPKILTAVDKPDEPIDLDDDAYVTGNGVSGGIVSGVPGGVVGGVPGGTVGGIVGGVPGGIVGGVAGGIVGGVPGGTVGGSAPSWKTPPKVKGPVHCPFPVEADKDQIDAARVALRVTVETKGTASKVMVLSDPGHGFARAARTCALGLQYDPPRDAKGAPMAGEFTVIIRFDR